MAKIMLVEDDNNLREIYGARLQAEGYDIVSAPDGEEALALAVKEKPDLIISDVMMPRISGFDMLDILRNAPETKETKVIMMTALSQAEDKARADKLGADRYLVKSQVTLEDVANVVHDVLGDRTEDAPSEETPTAAAPEEAPAASVAQTPTETPPAPEPAPAPAVELPTDPDPVAPAPKIPEVVPAKPTPEPATLPTVDAIANPVVEVEDEPAGSEVQAPPTFTAPTTAIPVTDDTSTATTDDATATTTDDSTLPPVVEPQPDPATIKVELPTLGGTPAAAETAAPAETPVTAEPEQHDANFVGPSLTEALAAEEAQVSAPSTEPAPAPAPTPEAPSTEPVVVPPAADSSTPSIANGVPTNIVTPTEPTAPAESEDMPPATPDPVAPSLGGGKVIQPINDPSAKPDLDALLAAEERKAAVENPTANTVITPEGTQPTPAPEAPKKNDDLNNIAL